MGMQKYSEVVGLPVLLGNTGKKVGSVEDVFFSRKDRKVTALLLKRNAYEVNKKLVLIRDVQSFGRNAVIVKSSSSVIPVKKAASQEQLGEKGGIRGFKIFTAAGEELGEVKDVLFDNRTGTVEGVEVSDGLYQDIMHGRKILPLFGKVEFSEDILFVDREAVEEMTETGGGIKNKFL